MGPLAETDPVAGLALGLAVILVAAKVAGHVALRLGAPAVLGELLAGIVLGNVPLGALHGLPDNVGVDMLARLGAMILVFEVGLELTIREVFDVGVNSLAAAVLGTVGSFVLGWLVSSRLLPGAPSAVPIFIAASLTATSIGISARVLKDLGRMRTREARIIIGAAVVDDVIGLVVLTVVSGWVVSSASPGAAVSGTDIALIVVKSALYLALSLYVGSKIAPRMFAYAARLRSGGALVAVGLSFCFFLAWAATEVGLAAIIGAFTAGLILEDVHSERFVSRGERPLAELVAPVSSFLVPVFFVVMGMRTDVRAFLQPGALLFAALLTLAALVGKLACALAAGRGANRLTVAFGMAPRGEVTLVFASLGASVGGKDHPFLDATAYSSLVLVVVLTALVAPAALKWSIRRSGDRATGSGEFRST